MKEYCVSWIDPRTNLQGISVHDNEADRDNRTTELQRELGRSITISIWTWEGWEQT